jgi:hypothetical protein
MLPVASVAVNLDERGLDESVNWTRTIQGAGQLPTFAWSRAGCGLARRLPALGQFAATRLVPGRTRPRIGHVRDRGEALPSSRMRLGHG